MNMKLYGDTDNPIYFWYVIILMFLIAIGLLLYFWRRGWIGGSDLEKIPDDEGEK
jgi:Mg2+ and Co2+ transporter CorA